MENLNLRKEKFKNYLRQFCDDLPDASNGLLVFPYEIRSGILNYTEEGFVNKDVNSINYGFFQKIFSGKESINVVWEGSTELVKPKGKNRYEYRFNKDGGVYYLGTQISGTMEYETEIYNDDLDHKIFKSTASIKIIFTSDAFQTELKDLKNLHFFLPTKNDTLKLYKIPRRFGDTWLYIEHVQYLNLPGDKQIIGCIVSFQSLEEKLQRTGQTLVNFIHEAAPGEPYAYPEIHKIKGKKDIYKVEGSVVDPQKVKYIQIEMLGLGCFSGITIIGRTINKDEKGNYFFDSWKFLLPHKFERPKIQHLNKTSIPSKNFFYIPGCSLFFNRTKNWIDSWKGQNDSVATNNFQGVLQLGSSNYWENNNTNHKSNKPRDVSKADVWQSYFYGGWRPLNSDHLGTEITLKTVENPYTDDELTLKDIDKPINILLKQSFYYQQQLELPLSYRASKPYRWSNIPIIGGMVSALIGDRVIAKNETTRVPYLINCFIDCDAAIMLANMLTDQSFQGPLAPLACFGGEQVPKWLGVESCNTTFCFELTDILKDQSEKKWDTKYLGQTKDENGDYLLDSQDAFLYSDNLTTEVSENSFVIDKILVQGIFAGDIKITCFGGNYLTTEYGQSLWTTTIMSNGEWTNSLRNWTTEINTGCWDQFYTRKEDDFTWPEMPLYSIFYDTQSKGKPKVFEISLSFDKEVEIHEAKRDDEIFNYANGPFSNYHVEKTFHYNWSDFGEIVEDKETFLENYKNVQIHSNYFTNFYESLKNYLVGDFHYTLLNVSDNFVATLELKDGENKTSDDKQLYGPQSLSEFYNKIYSSFNSYYDKEIPYVEEQLSIHPLIVYSDNLEFNVGWRVMHDYKVVVNDEGVDVTIFLLQGLTSDVSGYTSQGYWKIQYIPHNFGSAGRPNSYLHFISNANKIIFIPAEQSNV